MVLGGPAADVQRRGDLRIGEPGGNESEYLDLALAEARRLRVRGRGWLAAATRLPRPRSSLATRSADGSAPRRSNVARAHVATPCRRWKDGPWRPRRRSPATGTRLQHRAASPRFQLANGSAPGLVVTLSPPLVRATVQLADGNAVTAALGQLIASCRAARAARANPPANRPRLWRQHTARAAGGARSDGRLERLVEQRPTSSSPRRARPSHRVEGDEAGDSDAPRAADDVEGVRLGLIPLAEVKAARRQPRHHVLADVFEVAVAGERTPSTRAGTARS